MIRQIGNAYLLETPDTAYLFRITETGHPEHLYYGPAFGSGEPVEESDLEALTEKRAFPAGNMISYDAEHPSVTLEDLRLEASFGGKGDIREPFAEIEYADGSRTSDFIFEKAEIRGGKAPLESLPSAYCDEKPEEADGSGRAEGAQQLVLTLKERRGGLRLDLIYSVFPDSDVIVRSASLVNDGEQPVTVRRLMSAQLDLDDDGWVMTCFQGAWAREMEKRSIPVSGGCVTNGSVCGTSSSRANPFVMLHRPETSETAGRCFAFNLIYSGNHIETAERNSYGKTRFLNGIHPRGFSWVLDPGGRFESPEAMMTVSDAGFRGISLSMHGFIRSHIVRGSWKDRLRPVLLNSWEACYFQISEKKLLKLASEAKDCGVELFVMDDGWFRGRTDDRRALGDWTADPKKLPGGLSVLSEKIHDMGLQFGLWVEPEMVNADSDLYRSHPEWAMEIPDLPHSEGRTQRILDLANPEVVDHLIEEMTRVFTESKADYVKWDMNRIFSDAFSKALSASKQGETAHRYQIGLSRLLSALTARFPQVLFEGCASGGNRFDPGMLCYFPQIWASDDTDALERVRIQEGYSYGYPMSAVSAHVSSCPNHQTLRVTPMASRFAAAAFGVCGYECNLSDFTSEQKKEIAAQTALYKEWRDVLQQGTFYRGRSGNLHEWTCVSADKSRAVGMIFQELVRPNSPGTVYYPAGLDPARRYRVRNIPAKHDIRRFGDLINTQTPVHVRPDSFLHGVIAKFVTMPGETEDYTAPGGLLMNGGVHLKQAFCGTGYSNEVRTFQDFEARLYWIEAV